MLLQLPPFYIVFENTSVSLSCEITLPAAMQNQLAEPLVQWLRGEINVDQPIATETWDEASLSETGHPKLICTLNIARVRLNDEDTYSCVLQQHTPASTRSRAKHKDHPDVLKASTFLRVIPAIEPIATVSSVAAVVFKSFCQPKSNRSHTLSGQTGDVPSSIGSDAATHQKLLPASADSSTISSELHW